MAKIIPIEILLKKHELANVVAVDITTTDLDKYDFQYAKEDGMIWTSTEDCRQFGLKKNKFIDSYETYSNC